MFADSFCDSDWANHSHRRLDNSSFICRASGCGRLPAFAADGLHSGIAEACGACTIARSSATSHGSLPCNVSPQAGGDVPGVHRLEAGEPGSSSREHRDAHRRRSLDANGRCECNRHQPRDRRSRWFSFRRNSRLGPGVAAATAGGSAAAYVANDGRESHPSHSTGLSVTGTASAGSGTSGSASHYQSRRHDREPAGSQRPPHAGPGRR